MEHFIIRINLHHLKNETHVEFNENTDRVFLKYNPQALGIGPLYDHYKTAFGHETEALDFIRRSEITQKIARQDHVRDGIFRGLVDTVEAAMHHFDAAYVEAANAINNLIKRYGNISKKTLDDETAAIDDLLRELQQPALAQAVAQIGLGLWRDKLAQENTTLKQLMTQRYDETAAKTPYRMKDARRETDRYYLAIINRIEGEHLAGVAVNDAFVRELNAVIERFKHILAQEIGEHKPKPLYE
ncbi:MAG: DUF6261 family protein [Tannerella sp.]|jgi:triphosphoribosyl-dephospho-CoA synthetase|nr:DUF6261 family protein [Tannerella sp.]